MAQVPPLDPVGGGSGWNTQTVLDTAQGALARASVPSSQSVEGKVIVGAVLYDLAGPFLASHGVTDAQVTELAGILVTAGAVLYAAIRGWLKGRLAAHAAAIVATVK